MFLIYLGRFDFCVFSLLSYSYLPVFLAEDGCREAMMEASLTHAVTVTREGVDEIAGRRRSSNCVIFNSSHSLFTCAGQLK